MTPWRAGNDGVHRALAEPIRPRAARVRERLAVLAYVAEHGLKPAARRFDLDRKTVRAWRDRWQLLIGHGLMLPTSTVHHLGYDGGAGSPARPRSQTDKPIPG